MRRIARLTGNALFIGILLLLTAYFQSGRLAVVVISTAHGLKFVEMKVKYPQRELDFPCRHANQPIELPARLDSVKEALKKALAERSRFDV